MKRSSHLHDLAGHSSTYPTLHILFEFLKVAVLAADIKECMYSGHYKQLLFWIVCEGRQGRLKSVNYATEFFIDSCTAHLGCLTLPSLPQRFTSSRFPDRHTWQGGERADPVSPSKHYAPRESLLVHRVIVRGGISRVSSTIDPGECYCWLDIPRVNLR